MRKGRVFLLDGPSGTGKTTLLQDVLQHLPLVFCKRVTTRAPRGPESDYDFVTPEVFEQMRRDGRFAASRSFEFGMSYGLPRDPVDAALAQGKDVLALIDLGTLDQARQVWPEAVGIFLIASLPELRLRLERRGQNSPEQIEERLQNASRALQLAPSYDYVLVNHEGQLERTRSQLRWIIEWPIAAAPPAAAKH